MPHCVDKGTIKNMKVIKFDGENWEQSMEVERNKEDSILNFSKV